MSTAHIGVLLPVRLETVLDQIAPGGDWILRVLIVPDEASIDRFDGTVDPGELDDLEAMWALCGDSLDSAEGPAAFRGMAARHGAARTAWLARTLPAGFQRQSAILRTAPGGSAVRGFPKRLEIWIGRGGAAPTKEQELDVQHDRLSLGITDPTVPLADRWWASWQAAVDAGLGASIAIGPDPSDIDVILVVGLGEESPRSLFAAHRDAGRMAVLEPGVPTNAIGEPADLGRDPETWRITALSPPDQVAAGQIGFALVGDRAAFGPLPGASVEVQRMNQWMVQALWPVLWGRALKDVWDLGDEVFEAGLWAGANLFPEGPLPPIRIADQPYGLLPVTALNDWVPAPGDPAIEERFRPTLLEARRVWAASAEADGTIVGADTKRAVDLFGRRATSATYAWRWMLPLEMLHLLNWVSGASLADLHKWWDQTASQALQFNRPPQNLPPVRRYATLGDPVDLAIPLVVPTNAPYDRVPLGELIDAVARAARGEAIRLLHPAIIFLEVASRHGPADERTVPNSLLLRLLVHAMVVAGAEVARQVNGQTGPLLEPIAADTAVHPLPEVARWLTEFAALQQANPSALAAHAGSAPSRLFEAAAFAIRRLSRGSAPALERIFRATLDAASHRVDPWITGIAWRRLVTLQSRGAEVALGVYGWVDGPLRGTRGPTNRGLIHAPSDPQARAAILLRDRAAQDGSGRWDLSIDSARARLAYQIGEEVRQGSHLYEALGRAIERRLRRKAGIDALRRAFPQRVKLLGTDRAVRRTCNGLEVLGAAPTDPRLVAALTPAEIAALAPLREAVAVYGDLLLADAAYHMVAGNPERAGAAMDAAAGLATPPELALLRTPRGGRAATTAVVTVLPEPSTPLAGPAALADPAVAGFLQQRLDPVTNDALWRWRVLTEGGQVSVRLDDLGLTVADSLSLTIDDLNRLAIEHARGVALAAEPPEGRARAERLARLLGSRPVVPRDLVADGTTTSDTKVRDELLARLVALLSAARSLARMLRAGFGEELQRELLREASRWGIAPIPKAGATFRDRLRTARTILEARIRAVPPLEGAPAQSADRIARAIADLASPGGRLPILARLTRAEIGVLSPVDPALLGRQWLEVVAAVRSRLAPLEAHQLGSAPLAAWTSRPGDPWQKVVPPPASPNAPAPTTALVVAYGPPGTLDGGAPTDRLAAGLVDSWVETVPHARHSTVAAFGFNAPSARPPQAILLAVTPDENQRLDHEVLVATLLETRQLLRARMATPDGLGALTAALPSNALPATEPSGVRLES